ASLAHQIAHPESIRQGENKTSAAASAEQTLARTHPEVYADMVSKLATDGQYTTADGKVVKAQGFDNKALDPKSDATGQRSYTSELFQNGAVQLGLGPGQEYRSYASGDARAVPRPEGVTAAADRGERVIDNNTKPPTVKDFPGLPAEKQAE